MDVAHTDKEKKAETTTALNEENANQNASSFSGEKKKRKKRRKNKQTPPQNNEKSKELTTSTSTAATKDINLEDLKFENPLPIRAYFAGGKDSLVSKKKKGAVTNRTVSENQERAYHQTEMSLFFTPQEQRRLQREFTRSIQENDPLKKGIVGHGSAVAGLYSSVQGKMRNLRGLKQHMNELASKELTEGVMKNAMDLQAALNRPGVKVSKKNRQILNDGKAQLRHAAQHLKDPNAPLSEAAKLQKTMFS